MPAGSDHRPAKEGRLLPRTAAILLLLLIGCSGLAAGLTITQAMTSTSTIPVTGVGIGAGIALYGALTAIAGAGLIARRRWAWWLGVATIVAGALFLGWLIAIVGGDEIFAFGIVLWGVALVCLLAPTTRASVGPQVTPTRTPGA